MLKMEKCFSNPDKIFNPSYANKIFINDGILSYVCIIDEMFITNIPCDNGKFIVTYLANGKGYFNSNDARCEIITYLSETNFNYI